MGLAERFWAVRTAAKMLHRQVRASGVDLGFGSNSHAVRICRVICPFQPYGFVYTLAEAGVLRDGVYFPEPLARDENERTFLREAGYGDYVHLTDAVIFADAWAFWRVRLGGDPVDADLDLVVVLLSLWLGKEARTLGRGLCGV